MNGILGSPHPLVASALVFQLPDEVMDGAPAWVVVFLLGVSVTVFIAEKFGKLPSNNRASSHSGSAGSFVEEDRKQLRKVTDLLATRDDDGVERFIVCAKHARENAEHLAEIAKILETQTRHLETIAAHIQRSA